VLAYVDESGDMGMKLNKNSSPLFVVTASIFFDREEASRCYSAIESLREELGIKTEFHFTSCQDSHRHRFLDTINSFSFQYLSVVFDKRKLQAQDGKLNKPLLQYPVYSLFSLVADRLENATVVIDKTGSSAFRKLLSKDLRRDINSKNDHTVIQKVKSMTSHSHNLLQLADMVCGSVARSYRDDRPNPESYRDKIRSHEISVTVWP